MSLGDVLGQRAAGVPVVLWALAIGVAFYLGMRQLEGRPAAVSVLQASPAYLASGPAPGPAPGGPADRHIVFPALTSAEVAGDPAAFSLRGGGP